MSDDGNVQIPASAVELLETLATAAIAAKDELGKNRQYMAVLFADLCNSTSYKQVRGDVDGLLKHTGTI